MYVQHFISLDSTSQHHSSDTPQPKGTPELLWLVHSTPRHARSKGAADLGRDRKVQQCRSTIHNAAKTIPNPTVTFRVQTTTIPEYLATAVKCPEVTMSCM
jgi:hypothetical protein